MSDEIEAAIAQTLKAAQDTLDAARLGQTTAERIVELEGALIHQRTLTEQWAMEARRLRTELEAERQRRIKLQQAMVSLAR